MTADASAEEKGPVNDGTVLMSSSTAQQNCSFMTDGETATVSGLATIDIIDIL